MHDDQKEILKALCEARKDLREALSGLGPEGLEEPLGPEKWRVRDLLAHLNHWSRWGLSRARQAVEGAPNWRAKGLDFDGINEGVSRTFSYHPVSDVMAELEYTYREVVEFVSTLDSSWFERSWEGRSEPVTLKKWFGFFAAEHERDHAAQIKKLSGN